MIKNYIFLGAPGVGKGTMAKKLAKYKGMIHISTGDIFRSEIKNETILGKKVKSILDSGQYVPDEITNEIVKGAITKKEVLEKGFILDGYPRTDIQANFLKENNVPISGAVLFEASDEIVISRLLSRAEKENRKDDTPEVIENRLKVYNEKTAPLISWYEREGLLTRVDASNGVEENFENLIEVLDV